MKQEWIEPTPAAPLTGDERFSLVDATVLEFWQWAFSDLRMNVTRGILLEFLVARAVGDPSRVRAAWDNYDVTMPVGVRVEVKASAYLQSWAQRVKSRISFSGLRGRPWTDKGGMGAEQEVRADVFVFGIQTSQDPAAYDALDISQWEFRVLPARVVEKHGVQSVGLSFLNRHAPTTHNWRTTAS